MTKEILLVLALTVLAGSISAQDVPKAELSMGYSYFRAGFSSGVNQQGGSVSAAVNANRWLGLLGDLGVYHASPFGSSLNTYTFLVGPRFSARNRSRITPFAQALIGGAHLTAGSSSGSVTPFAIGAGGGIDVQMTKHLALRPQLDYFALRSNGETLHSARGTIAMVFRFGDR
jgi:hypothetical protein